MEKRGRQIFSKIVRASKLTRQRILEIQQYKLRLRRIIVNYYQLHNYFFLQLMTMKL